MGSGLGDIVCKSEVLKGRRGRFLTCMQVKNRPLLRALANTMLILQLPSTGGLRHKSRVRGKTPT